MPQVVSKSRFFRLALTIVPGLIVAGFIWAADTYYDLDANKIIVNQVQRILQSLEVVGNATTTNIYPSASNTYTLGALSYQWANIYTATTTFGGGLFIDIDDIKTTSGGDLTITVAGDLTVTSTDIRLMASTGTLSATSSQDIVLATGYTERTRILSSGNFGIATTTPSYKLHVWGSAGFGTSTTPTLYVDSGNGRVGIGTTTPAYKLEVASGGATTALFGTSASDQVVIGGGSGKLTVGVVDPWLILNTNTATTSLYFRTTATAGADDIIFQTAGISEKMRLLESGNLGIGTTTPASLLTVGSLGAGLQVDTSGVVTKGTWQGTPVVVQYGGTGAATLTGALIGNGTNAFTATTSLALNYGGTGATDAATARTNLGLAIGTNVQAYDAGLANLAAYNTNGIIYQTADNTFSGTSTLAINFGGTSATTAAGARTSLGAAASGANSDITSLAGLTTALTVGQGGTGAISLTGILQGNGTGAFTATTSLALNYGGTGATDAATARTNLGLAIGTNVQAYDAGLLALASYNTNGIIYQTANDTFAGTSTLAINFGGTGATTAAGARTSLGAAASGANSDITSLFGLTTALTVGQGGTGLTTLTQGYIPFGKATAAFGSSANLFWDETNSRFGIATTSPRYKLDVWGNAALGTTTNTNIPLLYVDSGNGRVGIGTTTPAYNLSVVGSIGIATAVEGSQADIRIYRSEANILTIVAPTAANTNLVIGDGSATTKITVGAWDPLYIIDGTTYATYGLSAIGMKEETTGIVRLQPTSQPGLFKYVIDFDELEEGSDLWVFRRITDFGAEMENLVVLLSAEGSAQVSYEKDLDGNRLIIYGSAPAEVSYRLSASRFDWRNWPTLATEQNGLGQAISDLTIKEDGSVQGDENSEDNELAERFSATDSSTAATSSSMTGEFIEKLKNMVSIVADAITGLPKLIVNGILEVKNDIVSHGAIKSIIKVGKTALQGRTITIENAAVAENSQLEVESEDGQTISFITYGLLSPRKEIMISGSGRLQAYSTSSEQADLSAEASAKAEAKIVFSPSLSAILSDESPLRVVVTPTSYISGRLYIAEKNIYGFIVNGTDVQDLGAQFDWIVTARLANFEAAQDVLNNTKTIATQANVTTSGNVTLASDECQNGANRPCSTEVGACQIGVEICEQGVWGECIGAIMPAEEICDEVDNDCDGEIDEGEACSDSAEATADEAEPEPLPAEAPSGAEAGEPETTSTDQTATTTNQ